MDVATPVSTTEEISKENCVLGAEKAAVSREGDDAIVNVSKEITFLETYIQNIGKNFNKNHTVEIMKFTSNIKDCFNKTLIDKIELSNTIINLQNTIKEKDSVIINLQREMIGKTESSSSSKQIVPEIRVDSQTKSYASMVKKPALKYVPAKDTKTVEKSHLLILEAKSDRGKLSDIEFKKAKENIFQVLQPHKLGIGIKSTGPTSKGGVVMSFQSENDCQKTRVELDKNPDKLQFKTKSPLKILPKMTIIGVGKDLNLDELQSSIIEQNTDIKTLIQEGHFFKMLFVTKNGDVVIKLAPQIRDAIKSKGFVCLNLQSFNVVDRFYFKSCFNCCQIGHYSYKFENGERISTCPNKVACPHCSEEHTLNECLHKEDKSKAKCANCKDFKHNKNNTNHPCNSSNCPTIEHNIKKIINMTDFGNNGY